MATNSRSLGKDKKSLDRDRILGQAVRYDALRTSEKEIKGEKSELGTSLREAAVEFGDEDGRSHVLRIGNFKVAQRASVSDEIDVETALKFLESKDLLDDCTTRSLDKGAIEQCVQSGEITVEELEDFMEEKVSYKIEVKKVK